MDLDRGQELEHPVRRPVAKPLLPRRAGLSRLLDTVDKDAARSHEWEEARAVEPTPSALCHVQKLRPSRCL
jgi:hypothetical protein